MKVIQDLNAKKSCQTSDTPTKIIKLNSDIFSNLIYKHFNYCIDKGKFPNNLKYANIVPIDKKNKCKKENYRRLSILPNLSKIYEESYIASYADDTTPYSCTRDTQTVIFEYKSISSKLFHRFQYNHLKVNPGNVIYF